MSTHTFFGKQRLCYTEVSDFTDYQGIGHDPMYKRYDSVLSVVKKVVPQNYLHFLATPEYVESEDQICWHVDKWQERPVRLTDLTGEERQKYKAIFDETLKVYKSSAMNLDGEDFLIMASAIRHIDEDCIYCTDDKVYLVAWGMKLDNKRHKVVGTIIHDIDFVKKHKIRFEAGEHGTISSLDKVINKVDKTVLAETDIPKVSVNEGWLFTGWSPEPLGHTVTSDTTFTAQYKELPQVPPAPPIPPLPPIPSSYDCYFDAGEHGDIIGNNNFTVTENTVLEANNVPQVKPHKGYEFKGWDISPFGRNIDSDTVFTAQYEKKIPWYRRWWLGLAGLFASKGCLKWLLWFLLAILLGLLALWLLKGCNSCSGLREPVNGVVPIAPIICPDGKVIDDNGMTKPVTGEDGKLPDGNSVVAPVMGEDGKTPTVIEQPGMPDILANRLFLFMEDETGDLEGLARDFKQAYPGEQYNIIGYDKEVKLLVIKIPEAERDQIRKTINSKIPNHKFIVFDEEIYELQGNEAKPEPAPSGWHLEAIHLKQGWQYTKGSSDVKIAVVDDGIQADHPMFNGRIVDAYNVFTQNNSLSLGEGHGTHTAGLATGSTEFYEKGASGVAPECMLMPVQVFDNGQCPLSALVAGVMYSVHNDADVVNISIGPSFKGLNVLPVKDQESIASNQFGNVAALWARVCKIAARNKTILVFAAGNDDILASIPPENRNESSIVVTAVDNRMYPTKFTNYGTCSDVSAPGKDILSSFPNSGFQTSDGTSMSAPIVTGTIALMKTLKKDISVKQVRNVLFSTGADVYGFIPPMVLVDKALEATKNGNFERIERKSKPVPDGVDVHLGDKIKVGDDTLRGPTDGTVTNPITSPKPDTGNKDETDYEAIRKLIREYKEKIKKLEEMLPKE